MKYLGMLLLLCAALTAAPALAETMEKAGVQAEVPQGWAMKDSQSGNNILGSSNVMLVTPDGEGQIVLSIFNVNETGAESLAQGMSQSLKGDTPEAADGGYRFAFRVEGTDKAGQPFTAHGRTFVSGRGTMLASLTCMGATAQSRAAMDTVMRSLRGTTPEVEGLLQSLRPGLGYLLP